MAVEGRRSIGRVKGSGGNRSQGRSSTGSVEKYDDRLRRLPPIHIDYDEAQSAEERGTYHSPIHLPYEGLFGVRPVARLKSMFRSRSKRSR